MTSTGSVVDVAPPGTVPPRADRPPTARRRDADPDHRPPTEESLTDRDEAAREEAVLAEAEADRRRVLDEERRRDLELADREDAARRDEEDW